MPHAGGPEGQARTLAYRFDEPSPRLTACLGLLREGCQRRINNRA